MLCRHIWTEEYADWFDGRNSDLDVSFRILLLMNHTAQLCCWAGEAQLRKRQRRTLLRNKLSDYCLKKPELIYQSRMKGSICYCSVQSKVCSSSMLAKGMSMWSKFTCIQEMIGNMIKLKNMPNMLTGSLCNQIWGWEFSLEAADAILVTGLSPGSVLIPF